MDEDYTLKFLVRHEVGELYRANLTQFLSRSRLVLIPLAVAVCAVGAVLLLGAITHAHITERRPEFIANVRPLLIYGAVALVGAFVLPGLATAKTLRDPRRKNGFTYYVSKEGIRVEGSAGRVEYNWTAFVKATEAHNAFSLFMTRNSFHLLPKRCFGSFGDVELFRTVIRANVPVSRLKMK